MHSYLHSQKVTHLGRINSQTLLQGHYSIDNCYQSAVRAWDNGTCLPLWVRCSVDGMVLSLGDVVAMQRLIAWRLWALNIGRQQIRSFVLYIPNSKHMRPLLQKSSTPSVDAFTKSLTWNTFVLQLLHSINSRQSEHASFSLALSMFPSVDNRACKNGSTKGGTSIHL